MNGAMKMTSQTLWGGARWSVLGVSALCEVCLKNHWDSILDGILKMLERAR